MGPYDLNSNTKVTAFMAKMELSSLNGCVNIIKILYQFIYIAAEFLHKYF